MKVVSMGTNEESEAISRDTLNYMRACEKEYAKRIAKELTKGYMKMLSNFEN